MLNSTMRDVSRLFRNSGLSGNWSGRSVFSAMTYLYGFAFFCCVNAAAYAQESGTVEPEAATPATTEESPFGSMFYMLPLIALMMVVMLAMRPGQKEKGKREDFIKSLKKNDRVVTAGGIVAKISNINTDQKTVKLLLDEKSGSSMTVTMDAISRVVTGDDKLESKED